MTYRDVLTEDYLRAILRRGNLTEEWCRIVGMAIDSTRPPLRLTSKEHDAVLAGLRLLQDAIKDGRAGASMGINAVYTNCGKHDGLSRDGIDELCERINCDPEDASEGEGTLNLAVRTAIASGFTQVHTAAGWVDLTYWPLRDSTRVAALEHTDTGHAQLVGPWRPLSTAEEILLKDRGDDPHEHRSRDVWALR